VVCSNFRYEGFDIEINVMGEVIYFVPLFQQYTHLAKTSSEESPVGLLDTVKVFHTF
jgi:hypothetical protein